MLKETVSGVTEDEYSEEEHQAHQNDMCYSLFGCLMHSTLDQHCWNGNNGSILNELLFFLVDEV